MMFGKNICETNSYRARESLSSNADANADSNTDVDAEIVDVDVDVDVLSGKFSDIITKDSLQLDIVKE